MARYRRVSAIFSTSHGTLTFVPASQVAVRCPEAASSPQAHRRRVRDGLISQRHLVSLGSVALVLLDRGIRSQSLAELYCIGNRGSVATLAEITLRFYQKGSFRFLRSGERRCFSPPER
jgi:hypothetical protein